jgi:hypothetical protein
MQTMEETIKKIGNLINDLKTGTLELDAFFNDSMRFISQYEIAIPDQNIEALQIALQSIETEKQQGTKHHVCAICDIGLTIAFAALILLTVVAVAAAISMYAPEIPAEIATTFLMTKLPFAIVAGVIIAGSGTLAAYICHHLIKCHRHLIKS